MMMRMTKWMVSVFSCDDFASDPPVSAYLPLSTLKLFPRLDFSSISLLHPEGVPNQMFSHHFLPTASYGTFYKYIL